jgi:hypothetical protein
MPKGEIIGYLACPWCALHHPPIGGLMTLTVNARGNIFAWCAGGPDGLLPSCGQGQNLSGRNSARVRALIARAERGASDARAEITPAPTPEPEPEHGPENNPPAEKSEPEPDAKPGRKRAGGKRDGFAGVFFRD